jgi:FtsZ-binding cell division protein ZapB
MTITDSVEINLNDSQADIQIVNANTTYCLWPRAGGKTGGGIAPRILRLDKVMPRSQILIVSDTYERLETRIIPNVMNFFIEKFKLIDGVDFIKYKKPPDNWTKPLVPLDRFERVISFPSGMALCLVSLAVEGSANAFNAQAAIFDEAKFLKEADINTEVVPALRGAEDRYGHLPEYLSKWFFTDKFGNVKWLLNKRKLVDKKAVDVVRILQMEIFRLEEEARGYGITYKKMTAQKIDAIEAKINKIRKHLIFVSEMAPYENKSVVGEFYFRSQKRTCSIHEYDVAILNKDPDQVEQCYYPTFTSKNKYEGLVDVDINLPFVVSMDYNYRISPMPIAQPNKLPGKEIRTINIVDYHYAENPKGIEDTVNSFCKAYENHLEKTVHYIFDHTAIGRSPIKTTFKDEVIKAFQNNNWNVIEHYTGQAPEHDVKHLALKRICENMGEDAVMVNMVTTEMLIKSIEQSPAVIVNGQTKKDKGTEKDPKFPAVESTHGSDAFDQLLWGLFEWGVKDQIEQYSIPISVM